MNENRQKKITLADIQILDFLTAASNICSRNGKK